MTEEPRDNPASWTDVLRYEHVVLKLGGNAVTPRDSGRLDFSLIEGVARYVSERAARGARSIVTAGGIGSDFFFEWARYANASDATQNTFGISLLNTSALILSAHLATLTSGIVSPQVPTDMGSLVAETRHYPVVVAGAVADGAITSDSQAALIARALQWHPVFVKRRVPFDVGGGKLSGSVVELTWADVSDYLSKESETARPGRHPPIDVVCKNLLQRDSTSLIIMGAEVLRVDPLLRQPPENSLMVIK